MDADPSVDWNVKPTTDPPLAEQPGNEMTGCRLSVFHFQLKKAEGRGHAGGGDP
jgi:hypothetical protein